MAQLFNTTAFRVAEQGMKLMVQSNKVIQQNIANAETPEYKCKYLYFEGVLQDKIGSRANDKYGKVLNMASALYVDENTKDQPDGNNVDNDTQQALFNKNAIMYDLLKNQLDAEFALLRSAIRKT